MSDGRHEPTPALALVVQPLWWRRSGLAAAADATGGSDHGAAARGGFGHELKCWDKCE